MDFLPSPGILGPISGALILDRHAAMAQLAEWVEQQYVGPSGGGPSFFFPSLNEHVTEYLNHYCPYLFKTIEACNGDQMLIFIQQTITRHHNGLGRCDDTLVNRESASKWPFHLTQHIQGAHSGGACIPDPTDVIIHSLPGLETHPLQDMYFRRCDGRYSNALRHVLKRPYKSQQPVLAQTGVAHRQWQAYRSLLSESNLAPIYINNGAVTKVLRDTYYGAFRRWAAGQPAGTIEDEEEVTDGEVLVAEAVAGDELVNHQMKVRHESRHPPAIIGFDFGHEPPLPGARVEDVPVRR